ncbi:MAG: PEP-CTERM sorting domain-containing protein [Phycisphaerales bacterium]|nr:PEP-CTERM sorting domain-containing protein [Phycisphaerales bacterium]
MKTSYAIATALVCAMGAASVTHADMMTNGDFETGDLTGWTVTNWNGGSNGGTPVLIYDIDGAGPLADSYAMKCSAYKTAGTHGGIRLMQTVTLDAGVEYSLDLDWSIYAGNSNSSGGRFRIIIDDEAIASYERGAVSGGASYYGELDATFTPTESRDYLVGVEITRKYAATGVYQYVDNFTMVPAPGTLALMGIAGLTGCRRRRA